MSIRLLKLPDRSLQVDMGISVMTDATTTILIEPLLLSREQTAAVLGGIDVSTLDKLQRRGAIGPRPVQLGGHGSRVFYRRDELERWCAMGCPGRVAWDHAKADRTDRPQSQPTTAGRKHRSKQLLEDGATQSPSRLAG